MGQVNMMRITAGALAVALPVVTAVVASHPARAEAGACSADIYSALRKPAPEKAKPVEIACDLTLAKTDAITRPIAFSGSAASGATLDCNGGTLDGRTAKARTVWIRSVHRADGSWDAPRDIQIRNCVIEGDVRIEGLGSNGQAEEVRLSSLEAGHTAQAQAAAPSGITLDDITFVANGGIPLYTAPGVTEMTVENSRFTGSTNGTAIYLDAESARNRIIGNMFDIRTARREMIAVDGSADNRIEGNIFENPIKGGIFVYRNCGEGGTIRHQKPERNVITGNTFRYTNFWAARPAVWLGSRQATSTYCFSRPDRPFGSSLSPYDYAQYNIVTGNRLPGGRPGLIVDHDEHNTVSDNR
ncbi:Right handed beta helix region [Xaviernesmea oryzae]|uniref:Right handed beta helix region n=1 Tax=Xaviernesmea oryzae TaxID=464029 RepID=A0A1X7EU80_9HYPH|nr:right-handed parallel beta-helix repeat-containing protein [Xaviernesmea oryzae]SMF40029.1 Right handed beta helix region [Xaviernesmea oryzae]